MCKLALYSSMKFKEYILWIGMLLGGYVWGSFADALGRKKTLLTAMLWNGTFGLVSAFSP